MDAIKASSHVCERTTTKSTRVFSHIYRPAREMAGLPGLQSSSSNVYDLHLASHNIAKRNNSFKGGRDPKLFQFVQDKFQFPASEYEIRLASSSNSKVWLYFGTLYHHGQPVCDRLYCSPCFENQKIEGISYYLSALMPRIKHYAKSVSTGNLAIHLHDKHNIVIVAPNASPGRPCRSKSRSMYSYLTK